MKSLSACISPQSQIFQAIAASLPFIIVFRPSILEFFIFLIVDTIAFALTMKFDKLMYTRIYPQDRLFFEGIDKDVVKNLSLIERVQFYISMCSFPKRRAVYVTLLSLPKVVPAALIIVFYWHHSISNGAQLMNLLGIFSVVFIYFYGAVYIEAHIFLSKKLRDLHDEIDLSDVFAQVEIASVQSDFRFQETLILTSISLMVCSLQAIIIYNGQHWTVGQLATADAVVGIAGILLVARLWHMGRKFVFEGFTELHLALKRIDTHTGKESLALHTDPLLAGFEKSFNNLLKRLRESEKSMSVWALEESEKSRYRALGEISALIAHDLSAPLHVIKFCFSSLQENPQLIRDNRYIENLNINLDRMLQLVTAIRARVKDPQGGAAKADFVRSHNYVLRILETQFSMEEFQKIRFELDPALSKVEFALSQTDLIHVLENIYRNAVTNLIENDIVDPKISVLLVKSEVGAEQTHYKIIVKDNGTGLSKTDFSSHIAYRFSRNLDLYEGKSPPPRKSMGLMLTQRLLEHYKGTLSLREDSSKEGTWLTLDLPKAPL